MTPEMFAELMQRELDANRARKGDFGDWTPSPSHLMSEIYHHAEKLVVAILQKNTAAVNEHAADIGNYCMKAVESFGEQ